MSEISTMDVQGAADGAARLDGRRQRTIDSRARIIAAMLDLTRQGHVSVSAELVAERANVGLRTVFRHFKDMDSLYREMSLIIEASLKAEFIKPFAGASWRLRLTEMLDRRAVMFEKMAPFKRAEAAHRHRSRFLADDVARLNAYLRGALRQVMPPEVSDDFARFEAIDLLMGFESWERLRRDQGLTPRAARDVLATAVEALLVGVTAVR